MHPTWLPALICKTTLHNKGSENNGEKKWFISSLIPRQKWTWQNLSKNALIQTELNSVLKLIEEIIIWSTVEIYIYKYMHIKPWRVLAS